MAITIAPFLWYVADAEAAARFYASVIPGSGVGEITTLPVETPSGPPGSVSLVAFTLAGMPFMAMSAGGGAAFNHAVSIILTCETQDEIDRLWDGLLEGGEPQACGWLRDRYGLSWQITPRRLLDLIGGPDRARAARVTQAMLGMIKLDLAVIEAA